LFRSLNYNNVQALVSNTTAVEQVTLKTYPTFNVEFNSVLLKNISRHLSTS
jgi:hypothetical protein